jgi:hypothetical protein
MFSLAGCGSMTRLNWPVLGAGRLSSTEGAPGLWASRARFEASHSHMINYDCRVFDLY